MKKILVIAFAFRPNFGSENEMGWGWVNEISMDNEVEVVCGSFNQNFIDSNHKFKISFIKIPKIFKKNIFFENLNYFLWSIKVSFKYIFKIRKYDIVHHITLSSFRFVPLILFFAKKIVIGPISGLDFIPLNLKKTLKFKYYFYELFRDNLIKINFFFNFNKNFKKNKLIIVSHKKYFNHFKKSKNLILLPLIAISNNQIIKSKKEKKKEILYVGRLLHWKGIDFVLNNFKRLISDKKFAKYKLIILGNGPYEKEIKSFIKENHLQENILLKGFVNQISLKDYYMKAALLIFPSLRDSGGFVILEAYRHCLPVITFNIGGPSMIASNKLGRIINIENKNQEEINKSIVISLKQCLEKSFNDKLFQNHISKFTWKYMYNKVYKSDFIKN